MTFIVLERSRVRMRECRCCEVPGSVAESEAERVGVYGERDYEEFFYDGKN